MSSTAVQHPKQCSEKSTTSKLSRKEAARKILGLIECDMTKREMTETEKNLAVKDFARRVDSVIAARRKS